MTEVDQVKIESKIKPEPNQKVFFSRIKYGRLRSIWDKKELKFASLEGSAINNKELQIQKPLLNYLEEKNKELIHLNFPRSSLIYG